MLSALLHPARLGVARFIDSLTRTRCHRAFHVCGPHILLSLALIIPIVPVADAGPASQPVSPTARPTLEQAKMLIETHQEGAAINVLRKFLASSPKQEDLDDAYLLMAAALVSKKEHDEAITYLNQLLAEFPNSELVGRARLMLGAALLAAGKADAALSALVEAKTLVEEPEVKQQASRLIAELYVQKADWHRAIQAWVDELAGLPPEQRGETRGRIKDAVFEKLDKKGLLRLRDAYPTQFPGDLALIRLIEMRNAHGEDALAERNIRLFLARFPGHEYGPIAVEMLQALQSKLKGSQFRVAALLPLSGKLQPFGMEALNGISIAVDKGRDVLGSNALGLQVIDSETDKAALKLEIAAVLEDTKPVAVIGPLLSREIPLVAGLAEQHLVPFVTPSANVSDVRHFGPYLFSTALTLPLQAQRLAEHAIDRLGYRRFAALFPDTPHGRELIALFAAEVRKRGAELIDAEMYKETDTDFGQPIRHLKEADLKKYGQATTGKTVKNGKNITRTVYTPGFDALFLPAASQHVALIASQLAFYDVRVPLLGTSTWNAPGLAKLGDRYIDGSTFVDGFFLDSADQSVQEFVDRYRRKFQSDPSPFAAQAYEATRIVIDAIRRGGATGRAVYEQLLNGQDFPTLTGPAAFAPSGILTRRLYIIHIKGGRLLQLN